MNYIAIGAELAIGALMVTTVYNIVTGFIITMLSPPEE